MDDNDASDPDVSQILSTGDIVKIRVLGNQYSADQLLGLFWNHIERNCEKSGLDALFDKLIDIDPRLVCKKLALVCIHNYPMFCVLISRGYVIDKLFIGECISLIENLLEYTSIEEGLEILESKYKQLIDYLVSNNYIAFDNLMDKTVYEVNRTTKIERPYKN